jgi:hypothetical protein
VIGTYIHKLSPNPTTESADEECLIPRHSYGASSKFTLDYYLNTEFIFP